ncbi:hypothetical protein [Cardinium endosymbiont of Dermatophagoides farinae]|nr:hypothetical protein [Cardinium endosymbiont of Dermatophagoides farinae]
MKKKYTHYRVGLLIALFSLHTLSACVGIRQKQGFENNSIH